MTAGADGLPLGLLSFDRLLQRIHVVPFHVIVKDAPAHRTLVILLLQDGLPLLMWTAPPLGSQELVEGFVGQSWQRLSIPGDLPGQSLQPLLNLLPVLYLLPNHTAALGIVKTLGAHVGNRSDPRAFVQRDLGIPARLQQLPPDNVQVSGKKSGQAGVTGSIHSTR